MRKERGLSTVVTTVVMVLLSLVAIGVVWVVINNLLNQGTEGLGLDQFKVDLKIEKVLVDGGNLQVQVGRNAEAGSLYSIDIVVSDGTDSQTFRQENVDLEPLEKKTYNIPYDGLVKEVIVAPVFRDENGKETLGSATDSETIKDDVMLENHGAVAWLSLGGSLDDSIGSNDGTSVGGVDCSVDGKYGKACKFDGVNDYLNLGNDPSVNFNSEVTLSAWIRLNHLPLNPLGNGGNRIISRNALGGSDGYFLAAVPGPHIAFGIRGVSSDYLESSVALEVGKWYHVVGIKSLSTMSIFVNGGELESKSVLNSNSLLPNTSPLYFGTYGSIGFFNGTIDEVVMFDRALNAGEVASLYNFDFGQ